MDMFEDLFGSSNSGWPRSYGAVDPFGRRSYAPNISGMHPIFGRPQSADFRVPQQRGRSRNLDEYLVPDAAARGSAHHPRRQEAPKSAPKAKIIPVSGPESPKRQTPPKPNRFANKEDAALKIQCAFRGFSVRRTNPLPHLRKISETKQKLLNFKAQVADSQRVSVIRENMKERIMLTEGVMNLLLQLDSIQGALPLVREMRKATVREIVQFQESIDSILQKAPEPETVQQEEAEAARVHEPEAASEEQSVEVEDKPVEIADGEKQVDQEGNRKDDAEVELEQGNLEESSESAKQEGLEGSMEDAKEESIEGSKSLEGAKEETIEGTQEESTPGDHEQEMKQEMSEDREESEGLEGSMEGAKEELLEGSKYLEGAKEELLEGSKYLEGAKEEAIEKESIPGDHEQEMKQEMSEDRTESEDQQFVDAEDDDLESEKMDIEADCRAIVDSMVDDAINTSPRKREREESEELEEARTGSSVSRPVENPDYEKMLKKLMDDNAQLKLLVTECLKQTEMQNALICLLNQRVQKLEKRSKRNCNRRKEEVL